MRFIVDECTGPAVANWLRQNGYEVFSVFEEDRGAHDDRIIQKALDGDWILIKMTKILETRFIVTDAFTGALFCFALKMSEQYPKSKFFRSF
jgi:predicted nuclease of predicted toxin-antitoxin system